MFVHSVHKTQKQHSTADVSVTVWPLSAADSSASTSRSKLQGPEVCVCVRCDVTQEQVFQANASLTIQLTKGTDRLLPSDPAPIL